MNPQSKGLLSLDFMCSGINGYFGPERVQRHINNKLEEYMAMHYDQNVNQHKSLELKQRSHQHIEAP